VIKITPKQNTGISKQTRSVRFSEQERLTLEKEAAKLGMNFSDYVRERLRDSPRLERIEQKIDEIKEIVKKKQ